MEASFSAWISRAWFSVRSFMAFSMREIRYGRHISTSALPRYTASAFCRQEG